jgi:hypothetical protein
MGTVASRSTLTLEECSSAALEGQTTGHQSLSIRTSLTGLMAQPGLAWDQQVTT